MSRLLIPILHRIFMPKYSKQDYLLEFLFIIEQEGKDVMITVFSKKDWLRIAGEQLFH